MINQTETTNTPAAPALEDNDILSRVESRIAAGMSRSRLAMISGIDRDVLDRLLSGYAATNFENHDGHQTKKAIAALAQWLKDDPHPAEDDTAYASTPTFQHLLTLFTHAHRRCSLLAITGSWGIGKSVIAKYYVATHPRSHLEPGAVYIQFAKTDNKPVTALEKIREALNATGSAHRNGNLMNSIGMALQPGDLLILDECQRLEAALDIICSLHDDFGVGIVMIGNPDLSTSVWGKRAKFDALASRTERFDFPATTAEDVEAWLAWKGLPDGLNSAQRGGLIKACISIATRPTRNGGLRALANVFSAVEDMYPGQLLTGELMMQLTNSMKPSPL